MLIGDEAHKNNMSKIINGVILDVRLTNPASLALLFIKP
jgi:hypothetical protein